MNEKIRLPCAVDRPGKLRNRCGRLNRHWYAACLSEELGRRPLARVVMEEHLVLWRDGGGTARCHLDRCLHRNALLSRGAIVDGQLACPYHGWVYAPDGSCTHVPSMGPGSRAPEGRRLETFAVREQGGLVWVWMGHDAPTEEPLRRAGHIMKIQGNALRAHGPPGSTRPKPTALTCTSRPCRGGRPREGRGSRRSR